MNSRDAFDHWTGHVCIDERRRTALFTDAAKLLASAYPCTAGKGVSGEGFDSAEDRENWRHAVGAQAAETFLLSPDGRRALTSISTTRSSEAGSGVSASSPKETTETTHQGGRLDADRMAALAQDDANRRMLQISCVKLATISPGKTASLAGLSGRRRSRQSR